MSKLEKLIQRIIEERAISYEEAETLLLKFGFKVDIRGSHHIFRKKGYLRNISLKRRSQLLLYQLKSLKEIIKDHGY